MSYRVVPRKVLSTIRAVGAIKESKFPSYFWMGFYYEIYLIAGPSKMTPSNDFGYLMQSSKQIIPPILAPEINTFGRLLIFLENEINKTISLIDQVINWFVIAWLRWLRLSCIDEIKIVNVDSKLLWNDLSQKPSIITVTVNTMKIK